MSRLSRYLAVSSRMRRLRVLPLAPPATVRTRFLTSPNAAHTRHTPGQARGSVKTRVMYAGAQPWAGSTGMPLPGVLHGGAPRLAMLLMSTHACPCIQNAVMRQHSCMRSQGRLLHG